MRGGIFDAGVNFNQNQFDALCSFVWNLGAGSMEWDVGRYCRAGQFLAAGNAMLQYCHAGGVALPGLVRRRQEERVLFLTPVPAPTDPYHYLMMPAVAFPLPAASLTIQGQKISAPAQRWNERQTVMEYDQLRPNAQANKTRLDYLRVGIMLLRNRVYTVANWSKPPAWADDRHLGARWQWLNQRMQGQRVA